MVIDSCRRREYYGAAPRGLPWISNIESFVLTASSSVQDFGDNFSCSAYNGADHLLAGGAAVGKSGATECWTHLVFSIASVFPKKWWPISSAAVVNEHDSM